MSAFLVVIVLMLFASFRWGRRLWPAVKKVGSIGDELGGWTLFFAAGGATAAKKGVTGGAKVVLWIVVLVISLVSPTVRIIALCLAVWQLFRLWRRASKSRAELTRAGFSCPEERDLLASAVREAMVAMNLGTRQRTAKGDQSVAPNCFGWRKLPILIGGRPVRGQVRYECRVEPAPGKSVKALIDAAARGLDADEDPLRDAINSQLRSARGQKAKKVRAQIGRLPQFVMSTVEHMTVRGEKVGVVRLTLWSTDPFRKPVAYPHNPAKPVVAQFTDPVPVGLLRSNAEATMLLARHTSIQGINGSGKSSIARPALIAAAHTDALIGVMAMKGPADYLDLADRFIGGQVVVDRPSVIAVLKWANQEIDRRNALGPAERAALKHLFLVLDEGQELEADIELIVPIVKKGRSAKVWLWSITQYGLVSVIPSTAAREMGQRLAGRIEGGVTQAQVAVGTRANKTTGPHLIPEAPRWIGVLFGSDGNYLRTYWVSAESLPGEPKSGLARAAAALKPRPDDPEGYVTAATKKANGVAVVPAAREDDGTIRIASGEATAVQFAEASALPGSIRVAFEQVYKAAGLRMPGSRVRVDKVRPVLEAAAENDPETVDLIAEFLQIPLPTPI